MTSHDSWTDKLSDYLDDELPRDERAAVEAHLAGCAECAGTLEDLRRIVATAANLPPVQPSSDLWNGIARRIEAPIFGLFGSRSKQISFTLPQLAAASLLLATLSGGAVALFLRNGVGLPAGPDGRSVESRVDSRALPDAVGWERQADPADGSLQPDFAVVPAVGYADAQYDAAVADLERALESGRGRLDKTTIFVVEENLAIIDRAIAEARSALGADPSNGYLSGHLMEVRRRKLDLLRRAAGLTEAN